MQAEFSVETPPYHVAVKGAEGCLEREVMDRVSGHQFVVRRREGKTAVTYQTHWKGIVRTTWEGEVDLYHFVGKYCSIG